MNEKRSGLSKKESYMQLRIDSKLRERLDKTVVWGYRSKFIRQAITEKLDREEKDVADKSNSEVN